MTEPSARQGSSSHPDNIANDNDHNNHRVRFAEEGPEPVIYQHNPRRLQDDEPSPPPGPAVYWDENESIAPTRNQDRNSIANTADTANLAQYTFYREPTPPPYRPEEKAFGNDAASGRIAPTSSAGGIPESERQLHLQPQRSNWSEDEEMSPVAKRKLLWIIIGIAIVIIGVAVGVGVGVGVSVARKSSAEAQEQSESSTTPPVSVIGSSPTPTPSATLDLDSSATSSASSYTYTPSTVSSSTLAIPSRRPNPHSDCPAANNTMYQVPGSHKHFLRLCGVDYHGSSSSRDLSHMYTASMADCMNSCASFDQCTAVGWGFLPGDTGKEHRCYMKTDLKAGHAATSDWCFAILQ
ncbi:hypothetical protein B0T21DRAFT_347747 [Apiosordaria backusii]|uniref:Apple domain-containing protein n=1 Tax=Apiosordaria backusii TaxID=314023 RepID=A0AA40EDF4_9PEZI|nr:hypothetical protein B0T21DRAFT_347747 [Apiosordaria backusii]